MVSAQRVVMVGLGLVLVATGSSFGSQQLPERGWYVVRPGDTLEDITDRHGRLGGDWRRTAELNPSVLDPNLIFPGVRLVVDLAAGLSSGAVVVGLDRGVDLQPTPLDWIPARDADILTGRSGLRTGARASAALVFGDGSALGVAPDSVIFLAGRELVGSSSRLIEVLVGQTDVRRRAGAGGASPIDDGIEVVLGEARAQARPSTDGLEARARRRQEGDAQVMLYRGEAAVEASQTRVQLGPGMGTTVAPRAAPTAPEKLPVAPHFEPPSRVISGAAVRWDVVPEASSYVVEQCADATCERVKQRTTTVDPSWTVAEPAGTQVVLRVAALTATGLDGFSSPSRAIEVVAELGQLPPPRLAAAGNSVWFGDLLVLGAGGFLETDPPAQGLTLESRLNGEVSAQWASGWPNGRHEVELVVADDAGRSSSARQPFVSDLVAPTLSWQTGDEKLLEIHGLGDPRANRRDIQVDKPDRRVGLEWSTDGNNWWPLLVEDDRPDEEGVMRTWTVFADAPQLFLRKAKRGRGLGAGAPVRPERDLLVRIVASDEESAVRSLSLAVVGGRGPKLRIETVDLVGNSARVEWPLDRDRL